MKHAQYQDPARHKSDYVHSTATRITFLFFFNTRDGDGVAISFARLMECVHRDISDKPEIFFGSKSKVVSCTFQ